MKLKKFIEHNNFIQIGDFITTIDVDSPTYGSYKMTKIATIDLIGACEAGKLVEIFDMYSKIREGFVTNKAVTLESKVFGNQSLKKFEFYIPLLKDNVNWIGNARFVDNLPVAYTQKYLETIINKIINY